MKRIARKKNLLAVLFLISFTIQVAAQESWWEFYDLALRDVKAKNWSIAEERMKAALQMQPNQGKKIRAYGARYVRYFPEYYLGVIAFNEGKYQAALELFLKVQNAGLISKGDEEYPELSELSRQAMTKLNPPAESPGPAPANEHPVPIQADDQKAKEAQRKMDLTKATEALSKALNERDWSEAQRIAPTVEALDPQNPELLRFKDELIKQAEEQKNQQQVGVLLDQAQQAVKAKNYGMARTLANKAKVLETDNQRAKDILNSIEILESIDALHHSIVAKDWVEAQKLVRKVEKLDPQNAELAQLRPLIVSSDQVRKPNHESTMAQAMLAFYSGHYVQSAELLEPLATKEDSSAKIYFYLACSNAALAFEQTKQQRQQLLETARQEFAEARKIDPLFRYDRKFISPRILQIYEGLQK